MSSTTFDIALSVATPATTALLAIFLRPPPEVAIAIKTSSLAAVDISDNELTAIELKFVLQQEILKLSQHHLVIT